MSMCLVLHENAQGVFFTFSFLRFLNVFELRFFYVFVSRFFYVFVWARFSPNGTFLFRFRLEGFSFSTSSERVSFCFKVQTPLFFGGLVMAGVLATDYVFRLRFHCPPTLVWAPFRLRFRSSLLNGFALHHGLRER